jgi:hypothetical protein
MKAEEKRKMLTLLFDESMIRAVDDFRFKHRFESRVAAIKWLLQFALSKNPKP